MITITLIPNPNQVIELSQSNDNYMVYILSNGNEITIELSKQDLDKLIKSLNLIK
jgi:hypothetical protein